MGGFGKDPIPGWGPTEPEKEPAPALRPETAHLRALNGPCAGREFPLNALRLILGRNDPPLLTVDIDLTDCEMGSPPKISRRHAEIRWADDALQIVDLGSLNGTWIDNTRLPPSEPTSLAVGSRLRLANLEFEVAA
ncbi:MAG TPA: FHA domain-containing protein [Chthonomonadaceae bacterium]|nr:FHA domain-containing protein [Chthonomonadaceae bacterium]